MLIVNFFEKHDILKQTFMFIENKLNTITTLYILIYIHNIDKQRWNSIKEYPHKIYLIHIYITNIQNSYTLKEFS